MLNVLFQVDKNKLACQMCLLRATRIDPLMTCFFSCRIQVNLFITQTR